ncbi:MAG: hypothetical protein ACM3XP_06375 [Nitrososphaerales archaeon]
MSWTPSFNSDELINTSKLDIFVTSKFRFRYEAYLFNIISISVLIAKALVVAFVEYTSLFYLSIKSWSGMNASLK